MGEAYFLYDTVNQLTRENNQAAGKTWVYAYDNAGNITSKREYAYTTGTPGSVLSTITYTYGDSAWGDLLTAYNGNAISYDTIGNPLSDGTWTYTWEHGRELASMYAEDTDGTDNEVTVSYTYNADGLRIRKTVTTKTYEAVQHTVTFVADGTTVKTMTVNDGYTLTASDYPAVPPKSGYTGSWPEHSSPITANTTITAVYTANPTYTVTFVADGVTVKTMTVNDGYTLTASDYPAVPAKSGYTGSWPEHSSPITANTTITAVYTPIPTEPSEPPAATHTVTFRVTYSASYGYTVKTMTVEDGYVLTASDYPTTYGITWQQYTSPITSDVTVNGTYSWGGYGAAEEAEATGEIAAEAAAESTAVSRTGSTTLVKTVTETYDYVYNGGRLSQVKKTTSTTTSSGTTNATDTLNFTYDANGTPMAVKYNGTMYYFVTNVQGDVTAILNTSGTAVASYTYDAWGNILTTGGSMASTLGILNPLRYRGYVYDTETGRYYLRSRYYYPQTGRFLNTDSYFATGLGFLGNNMFGYCNNNPVCCADPHGSRPVSTIERFQDISIPAPPNKGIKKRNNDDAISAFYGVSSPDAIPEAPSGAMLFVENIISINVGMYGSIIRGRTLVMDRDKYCEYAFWGVGVGKGGVNGALMDKSYTKGYVYGVTDVDDYCGLFLGGSSNMVASVFGGAWAPNGVYAEIIEGTNITASIGGSLTYYVTSQSDWIYGAADFYVVPNVYQTSPLNPNVQF